MKFPDDEDIQNAIRLTLTMAAGVLVFFAGLIAGHIVWAQ